MDACECRFDQRYITRTRGGQARNDCRARHNKHQKACFISLLVRTIIYLVNMTAREARTIQGTEGEREREMNLYLQGLCGLLSQVSVRQGE